jgi:hypothetical protein
MRLIISLHCFFNYAYYVRDQEKNIFVIFLSLDDDDDDGDGIPDDEENDDDN